MRARVIIYDDTISDHKATHLALVCKTAVGGLIASARQDSIDAPTTVTVITVCDVDGSSDPDHIADLLHTTIAEHTDAPCDIEIETPA